MKIEVMNFPCSELNPIVTRIRLIKKTLTQRQDINPVVKRDNIENREKSSPKRVKIKVILNGVFWSEGPTEHLHANQSIHEIEKN